MRSSRSNKYQKKYKKLIILAQLLAIWYAVVLSTAALTSDTFAFFSDSGQTKMSIQTGTWWDGSDLSFISESIEFEACDPTDIDITVKIKNDGFDMIGSTEYEVYYSESGDPKGSGEKVVGGVIDPIKQGQNTELIFENADIGTYIFKLYQREGYDDNYEERTELWSEKFVINECVVEEEPEKNEEVEEVTEEDVVQEEKIEKKDEEQSTETKVEDEKNDSEKEETNESNEDNSKDNIEEKEIEKPEEEQPKEESKEEEKEIEVNKVETKELSKKKSEEEVSESTEEGDE